MTTIWDNNNSYSAESKAREDYDLETGKFDYEKEYLVRLEQQKADAAANAAGAGRH